MRKIVLFLSLVLMGSFTLSAQNLRVAGLVTGPDGSPVAGATVVASGTNVASITGADGRYSINAPSDGTLDFSLLGMVPQQVAISGRTTIDVRMANDATQIEGVIVTGIGGMISREAYTGSAIQLDAEVLAKRQTTNIVNALVGNVPGLQIRGGSGQPGSSGGTVSVRGTTQSGNMGAEARPLVIVDGSPYPANLSNIPQSDIESVTVLKDAASAALYGARGAAGVIIVTTKRPSREAVINAEFKMGINTMARPRYDVITDPGEYYEAYYAQLYNQNIYANGMGTAEAEAAANRKLLTDLAYNTYTYPKDETLIIGGKLNPRATLGRKVTHNGVDMWLQPDSWWDEAWRSGIRSEANVSMSGSTDRSNYYLSVSYLNEEGIVQNSNYDRITARLKSDYQVKKWLKVSGNFGFVNSETSQNSFQAESSGYANNLFSLASRVGAIYPVYLRQVDATGNVSFLNDQWGNRGYDYGVAATGYGVSRPFLSTGNPHGENQYNKYGNKSNQLNAVGAADFLITDKLTFNVTSSVTWGNTYYSTFSNMYYGNSSNVGGIIKKEMQGSFRTNNRQSLAYRNSFGQHNVTAQVGHEYWDDRSTYLDAESKGMFSPDLQEINGSATKGKAVANSRTTRYNNEGYYLHATYDYDTKYLASATYRREASSRFHPDHRWGNFWSLSAGWLITREEFMSNVDWLNMLKLRASVGQRGLDAIPDFVYADRYSITPSSDTGMSAALTQRGNPLITWETNTDYTVGADFSVLKGRINGSVDFFYKHQSDMLNQVSVPESAGFRTIYRNVGDIRYRGVELTLNGDVIQTNKVNWNIYANISHQKSKILSLPGAKINPETGGYNESNYWYKVGGRFLNSYRKAYAGVNERGEALYYMDGNTAQTYGFDKSQTTTNWGNADYYECGDMQPTFFGGFGTSLQVGNLDASLTFDYQIGGLVYDVYYSSAMESYTTPTGEVMHKDWVKAWSPTNTSSNIPRWQYGDAHNNGSTPSDRFLTNASYLNFQSFSLGYTLPKKWLKEVGKVRVYAMGENLIFWSARKGLDPRYAFAGNDQTLTYSPMRTISGGVQLTF